MSESSADGASVLLVASAGGHLTQLEELSHRLVASGPFWWVTFETDQTRSLLAAEEVDFMSYIPPRAFVGIMRIVPRAWRLLRARRPELAVSTGSGIALAFLPLARAMGIEAHYIESATRARGPSFTGRLLAWVPGVHLHTQHRSLADRRWTFVGSVFEGYEPVPADPVPLRRVVVTVGTMETYGFERLLGRLVELLPEDTHVVWQTGSTDVSSLPIEALISMSNVEIEAAIDAADVVIGHAGTGTALTCLRLGKRPILIPRRADHGEHVDDHQAQTADYLSQLGLASVLEADTISLADIEEATAWRIRRHVDPEPIVLEAGPARRTSIRRRLKR